MSQPIELVFRYSEEDFLRAMRAHYASRLRWRRDIAVATVVAIVGAYLWRSPTAHWLGIACVAASTSLMLILFAAFIVIPRIVFRSDPKYRDEYSLVFSDEGIHFRTTHIDSELKWGIYAHGLVDLHSYILYYGTRSFTIVPRRVFRTAEQERAFDQLLVQNVPKIARTGAL